MTDVALVEANDAFSHLAVRGRLDAAGVDAVDFTLTSRAVTPGKPAIIDLGAVDFIASLGIAMLVRIARDLRGQGAGMAVVATEPVKGLLEMMKMDPLFSVVATRDDALRALGLT
jgi:anti-anti-sigma factor